ncbi:MAG: tetratricopeptide repeat protein, partial [Saprospiraceae bacterium]
MRQLIDSSRQLTGQWKYEQARQAGEAAQKIALDLFGPESLEYADCLFNLGRMNNIFGYLDKVKPFYLEAIAIRREKLGADHPDYARSLNNLALWHNDMGQYEAAEPLYLQAIGILKKVSGDQSLDYAKILHNLAILYDRMGRYESAEPLYLQVKAIRENKLGKAHPNYADCLNNLANLYYNMGRYASAERLYLEAKAIWEKVSGKESLEYAKSLNNLASLYYSKGRYDLAEPLYLAVKTIREKKLGLEHADYASSLNNLALVYTDLGRYKSAESLFLQAAAIWGKVSGKEHPYYAECLTNLAVLYQKMHRYQSAEPLYVEATAIWEKALGSEHPNYIQCLNKLAGLYRETNRDQSAGQLYLKTSALTNALLSKSSRFLSDVELFSYVQLCTKDLDRYYAFAQIMEGKLPDVVADCYDNALFHKGFLLNVSSRISKLAATNTVASQLNNQLKSFQRRLAKEYAKPLADRRGVDELEAAANSTEKELVRTVTGFGEAIRQVRWQEVQAALKPDEAAIEFIHYRDYTPDPTDSIRYAALVLRSGDSAPHLVPLFEEQSLAPWLPKSNDMDQIDGFYRTPTGKTLYQLIWQPLSQLLAEKNTVYYAPSGLLHRINLGAIPISPSLIFADRYRLVILGSTRQLVNQNAGTPPMSSEALLFGGIQYE